MVVLEFACGKKGRELFALMSAKKTPALNVKKIKSETDPPLFGIGTLCKLFDLLRSYDGLKAKALSSCMFYTRARVRFRKCLIIDMLA